MNITEKLICQNQKPIYKQNSKKDERRIKQMAPNRYTKQHILCSNFPNFFVTCNLQIISPGPNLDLLCIRQLNAAPFLKIMQSFTLM